MLRSCKILVPFDGCAPFACYKLENWSSVFQYKLIDDAEGMWWSLEVLFGYLKVTDKLRRWMGGYPMEHV